MIARPRTIDSLCPSTKYHRMIEQIWPRDWRATDDPAKGLEFELELSREVPAGHALFGRQVALIARRDGLDDFLFKLDDHNFAQVHLTWSVEKDPFWPHTEINSSIEEWACAVVADENWADADQ